LNIVSLAWHTDRRQGIVCSCLTMFVIVCNFNHASLPINSRAAWKTENRFGFVFKKY